MERRLPSGFRKFGSVPCQAARACAGLLPATAAQPAASHVLLISRDGMAFEISPAGTRFWRIQFDAGEHATTQTGTRDVPALCETGSAIRESWRGSHGALLFLTEWEGLYASLDGGHLALPVAGGLPKETRTMAFEPGHAGRWYAAAADRVFQSADGGVAWQLCGRAGMGGQWGNEEVAGLSSVSGGQVLLAVTREGRLLRSDDGGKTWERRLEDEPAFFRAIAAEGMHVRLASSRGMLHSEDGGEHWHYENRGLRRVSVDSIRLISLPGSGRAYEGANAAVVLLGTRLGAYLLEEEDNDSVVCEPAGSWADSLLATHGEQPAFEMLSPPEEKRILQWCLAPLAQEWIFARSADGVYASRDQGRSWETLPLPPSLSVTSMAVDLVRRRLLLGTYRFGLFAAELPDENRIAGILEPVHASPNPFGEVVVLRCVLSGENAEAISWNRGYAASSHPQESGRPGEASRGEGDAYLLVLSVHGQLIRRLPAPLPVIDPSGEQSLIWRWDGTDERGQPVANGLYLVTAAAGTQRFSGKLIKLQ